ncbi:hypothetical protein D9619_011064 [Psilocybe cf. subviscida]|uniref:Carrier domain-containing protein n=1 Tax=Psilocybe cf. subviscida TaxID=2480587 RepID=A0A8H5F065_9AGAR|nr:hypothetical protein D9619_011064 [Psilocybe cf. subviscida]
MLRKNPKMSPIMATSYAPQSRPLVFPPTDGTVTLPEVLDFHNEHQPQRTIFTFKADGAAAATNISFFEFRRAADRVAHFIRPERCGAEGEIIALVALSDTLLYQAVTVGLTRAGIVPYLMSPRNTAVAIIKMLKETSCHKLLTTQETLKALISEIKLGLEGGTETASYPLEIIEMPPLCAIFPRMGVETIDDLFEEFPKPATRPDLSQTLIYLHSSGSTGLPKSIRQSFRMICNWASLPGGSEVTNRTLGVMALPAFHTLGLTSHVLRAAYGLCTVALYPPIADTPSKLPVMPTPDNIIEHMRRTGCEDLVSIPALFNIWVQQKDTVEYLASLKLVVYSGGPLPSETGRQLVRAGVRLVSMYGGTEFGIPVHFTRQAPRTSEVDYPWEYFSLDENVNARFEPQGDGTYELQFLRHDTRHDLPVENMGNGVRGYATSDLFIPNASAPGFWKLIGRKDDVIIHSSGEKTVPGPMENIIAQSQYIIGVVMFGREHDQPGVLIELEKTYAIDPQNEADVVKARNVLWPLIEQANKVAPAFSKIYKEFILFSDARKPLPRAGKGTVMRKAALSDYHNEIEALYATVSAVAGTEDISPPVSWIEADVSTWLLAQLKDIYADLTFTANDDLFDQGLDSLSATVLRRRISSALKSDSSTVSVAEHINQNTVYAHPTVHGLSTFIASSVKSPDGNATVNDPTIPIENTIKKYSHGLDDEIRGTKPLPGAHTILLTGSTGNLGSHILESLLCNPNVERIYALNRPSSQSAVARHEARFVDKGFDVELLRQEKLRFLEGDASNLSLGLPDDVYEEVMNSVTIIIHNAWRLNFNLSLPSFESNIRGTRRLIDLGRASPYGSDVRFVFTSSVSQAFSWDTRKGTYPEEVLSDARYAVGMGYGESKYVCERILSVCGLRATSLRIGQITGGMPSGAWATTDWVPIMVKSGISLGVLPSQAGTASWIPMDSVAQAVLEIALETSNYSYQALNIVHPRPITFDMAMANVNEALFSAGIIKAPLNIIPQTQWSQLLEARALNASSSDMESIPAIKLLEFFRSVAQADAAVRAGTLDGIESGGLTRFSTLKAEAASETMKNLSPVDAQHARSWVNYWRSAGLLSRLDI